VKRLQFKLPDEKTFFGGRNDKPKLEGMAGPQGPCPYRRTSVVGSGWLGIGTAVLRREASAGKRPSREGAENDVCDEGVIVGLMRDSRQVERNRRG